MNLEQQIHLEDIIPNRSQPRLNFDEEGLKELADSIKEHGIIQPLVLRKLGDKYEIIAGERRYKAAGMAGLTTVPAVISNIDDNKAAEVAIVENIQRRNLTAIEEARSYKNLLDKGYLTQEGLAKKMGLSQSAISNKLRLLNLDDEVQQALLDEKISERHARTLLTIPDKEEQKEWLHRIINERLTVRQLDLELKKSNVEREETPTDDESTGGVPLVNTKPSVDEIKANATDIHDTNNKMSVEEMMKPTEVINEEIETLDINQEDNPTPTSEQTDSDVGSEIIDFGTKQPEEDPKKDIMPTIETPQSTNEQMDTEIIQNNNDSKFFNFAPETEEEPEEKNEPVVNTFTSIEEDNNNGFEVIDDNNEENSDDGISDMSQEFSQDNPFGGEEEPVQENEFSQAPDEAYDGINISSNNKFFTPTSEEAANKFEVKEQEEEFVNPMDRVDNLEGDFQSASADEAPREKMTLKDTINEIRKTIEKIGNNGVYAEVEELDFEDSYQINIKIPKDN